MASTQGSEADARCAVLRAGSAVLSGTGTVSTASTFLLMLLPKCPLCVAGYAAALSGLGIAADTYRSWLDVLIGLAAALATVSLWYRERRITVGVVISCVGVVLVLWGRLIVDLSAVAFAGVLIQGLSIVMARRRRSNAFMVCERVDDEIAGLRE